MAGKTVDISLKVSQEGLDNVVKSSKAVADFFADAAQNANQLVKSSKQIKAPTGNGGQAARASADNATELGSYGVARSTVGTGAGARDFAKQVQGLDGLVRVYATFAANVFALSAAFTALSKAMDVENMIKGLDQLGASSGRALGGLAKQVSVVSDGMLSVRDSIQAVAQASAAGLGTKQILQMTEVAKKASIALGRDMGDSITRITKGISKLEPELLDELGIMTRVDKATQDYARTVGKTTAELSQYEKQQAFANAVLKEGLDKFSSIDIAANPYQKLLASFQNLLTTGLTLVNKVLGPVAGYLAESPVALAGVIGLIATTLLQKAIPALSNWRAGLQDAAKAAADAAKKFQESFGDEFQDRLEKRFRIPDLQAKLSGATKAADEAAKAIAKLPKDSRLDQLSSVNTLTAASGSVLTSKMISNVNNLLKKRVDLIEEAGKADSTISDKKLATAKAEAAYLDKLLVAKKAELAIAKELEKAQDAAQSVADKKQGYFDQERIAIREADALRRKAAQFEAVSNAANNAAIIGVRGSWELLNKEIADKGLKGVDKFTTLAKGGFAAVGTRIAGILGSLSNFAMYIGIAVAGFQVLDAVFSKANKETEAFNSAVEVLGASITSAGKTLDELFNPRNISSEKVVKGITATANAFNDLKEGAANAIDSLKVLRREMNAWDKGVDWVKTLFGAGTAKLETELAKAIQKSLQLATTSGIDQGNLQEQIQKLLGTTDLSQSNIASKLRDTPELLDKVITLLDEAGGRIRENEQRFVSLNDRIDQASKRFQDFSNSLLPTDILTKLGNDVLSIGIKVGDLVAAPAEQAVAELAKISKESGKLIAFSDQDAQSLVKYSKSLNDLTEGRVQLLAASKEMDDKIIKATQEVQAAQVAFAESGDDTYVKIAEARVSELEGFKAQITDTLKNVDSQLSSSAGQFVGKYYSIASGALAKGAKLIEDSIGQALQKVALAFTKVELQGPQGPGDARRMAELASAEIEIQKTNISTQLKLIDSNQALTDAITKQSAQETLKTKSVDSPEGRAAQNTLDRLNEKEKLRELTATQLAKLAQDTSRGIQAQAAASEQLGVAQQKEALRAQAGLLTSQQRGELLRAEQAEISAITALEEKRTAITTATNNALIERSSLLAGIVGYGNADSQLAQAKLAEEQLVNAQLQERRRILDEIAQLQLQKPTTAQDRAQQQAKIDERRQQLSALSGAQEEQLSNLRLKNAIALDAITTARLQRELDYSSKLLSIEQSDAASRVSTELALLEVDKQANTISEEYYANRKAAAELAKVDIDQATRLAEIEDARLKTIVEIELKRGQVKKSNGSDAEKAKALEELNDQQDRANKLADKSVSSAVKQANAQKDVITATKKQAVEQAKFNRQIEEIANITTSLTAVFGDLGKSIGEGFDKGLKAVKNFKDRQARIEKDFAGDKDKLAEESTKNQLDFYAAEANAAKSMFGEKTAAYQLFASVEKAMHIARLAMSAIETATLVKDAATKIAAKVSEASVDGVAGVVKAVASMPFPLNLAAGAATAAVMGMLLSQIGGKPPKANTSGQTAADRQKVQGTGSSYNSKGEIVENGRGVLGDSSAKSDSVAKSIEIIKSTSVEYLGTSNKMLDALNSIDQNTKTAALAIYKENGIRSGTAFGNIGTGSQLLEKSGATSLGETIAANLKAIIMPWKLFSGDIISNIAATFGWGKKVSSEVIDSGIKIKGSFLDLIKNLTGAISAYETDLVTTTKSSWFGLSKSTSTEVKTQIGALGSDITSSISAIFANAGKLFVDVGKSMGMAENEVIDKLSQIPVDALASLKGLKGEDLQKEFSAVINSILDDAADTLFASMKKYQQFGEGMLETVVRVVDSNSKIKLSFDSIGKSYTNLSYDISEALASASGGLKNFLDKVASYKDSFLSEAEKLNPIRANVDKTLATLAPTLKDLYGVAIPQTREQFKQIVNAIDVSTASGQQLFTTLLNISDAFAKVTEEHQRLVDEYRSLEDELLATFRGNAKIKELIDKRATENMDAVTKAQYEQNKAITSQINSLSEYYDLMDQLDEVMMTDAQLRAKEREAISESNRALYDYLQAQKDLKSATEDLATQFSTIQSEMSSLTNAAAQSAQALQTAGQNIYNGLTAAQNAVTAANSALSSAITTLVQGFNSAQAALTSARNSLASSQQAITQGYVGALDKQASAQKAIVDKYRGAQAAVASAQAAVASVASQATKNLQNFSKTIKDFIRSLSSSDLGITSGPARVKLLQAQFNDLLTKALAGDTNAQGQLTGIAQQLLEAGKEQSSSALEYAKLYGQVTGTLDAVSSQIDQQVGIGNDLADQAAAAAASLASANAVLAEWMDVVQQSGIDLAALAEDPKQEYKDALKQYKDATTEVDKWKQAVQQSGASLVDTTSAVQNALDAYNKSAEAVNSATKALDDWSAALKAAGIDPNTQPTNSDAGNALEAFRKASQDQLTALNDLNYWNKLIAEYGFDTKAYANDSNATIKKYFDDWTKAKTDNDKAQKDLKDAIELLNANGIDWNKNTQDSLKTLKDAVAQYSIDQKIVADANAIIAGTKLDAIKGAIDALASQLYASLTAPAPTVKIPEAGMGDGPTTKTASTNVVSDAITSAVADPGPQYTYGSVQEIGQGSSLGGSGTMHRYIAAYDEGTTYVPKTGLAIIHEGEKITPAKYNGQIDEQMLQELRSLRQEVAGLKEQMSLTEVNTRKSKDILVRVTEDGTAMKVA